MNKSIFDIINTFITNHECVKSSTLDTSPPHNTFITKDPMFVGQKKLSQSDAS